MNLCIVFKYSSVKIFDSRCNQIKTDNTDIIYIDIIDI